jgi:hypothetical protein
MRKHLVMFDLFMAALFICAGIYYASKSVGIVP